MTSVDTLSASTVRLLNREYSKISNGIFATKLLALLTILGFAIALSLADGVLPRVCGGILLGLMFTHMLELQHQCLHYTAFNSRVINRLTGFILGIPMVVSFEHYRQQHLFHHRNCGTEQDKEFFIRQNIKRSMTLQLLSTISLSRFLEVFKNIGAAWKRETTNPGRFVANKMLIQREYRILSLIFVGCIVVLFLISRSDLILTAWVLPILLISEPLHSLIEFPEHHECDRSSKDPLKNTRTIAGSKFSFWFTNGNNYHVEHHLLPNVPIDKLPLIHKRISPYIVKRNASYLEFFWKYFGRLHRSSGSTLKAVIP